MPQGANLSRNVFNANAYIANITATGGTALRTSGAKLARITVVAASTAAGGVFDCAAVGSTAAGNKIFSIPATVGVYSLDWPCTSGITVFPGAGMTLAVSLA
jgi:hypothetical protein